MKRNHRASKRAIAAMLLLIGGAIVNAVGVGLLWLSHGGVSPNRHVAS